jgi:hypothetical protein
MFSLLTGFLARQWGLFFISIVLLVGLAFYVALGLWMVRAPKKVWVSLVYTPFYVLWKAILLAGIWLGVRKQGWVRTQR